IGADVLYVQRFDWGPHSEEDWLKMQKRRELTVEQASEIERTFAHARAISPVSFTMRPLKYNKRNARGVTIVGSTDQLLLTGGISLAQGRFLSAGEAEGGRPVCVIGSEVAENLFPRETPLEKKITIDGQRYEVVGVLEKQGVLKGDFDN